MGEKLKYHDNLEVLRNVLQQVGDFIADRVLPSTVFTNFLDEPEQNTGAAEMIDRHLYEQQELPVTEA